MMQVLAKGGGCALRGVRQIEFVVVFPPTAFRRTKSTATITHLCSTTIMTHKRPQIRVYTKPVRVHKTAVLAELLSLY